MVLQGFFSVKVGMSMISSEMELIIAFYLCLFRFHFIGVFRSCEKSHLLIVTLINSINYLTCCWYNRTRIFNNFAIFKFHLTLYSSFNLFGCCQFCLAFGYYFFCEFTKITNFLFLSTIESFFDHGERFQKISSWAFWKLSFLSCVNDQNYDENVSWDVSRK